MTTRINHIAAQNVLKIIAGIILLVCLAIVGHAADKPNPVPPPAAVLAENFHAGELQVEAFGYGELVNWGGKVKYGGGVGVAYFLTRGLGAGVRLSGQDFTGILVDQIEPRVYFRVPLWDRISPYGFVAATYRFPDGFRGCPPVQEGDEWGAGAGGGLEFKFTPHLGAKVDIGIYAERGRSSERATAGVNYSF